MGIMSNQPRSLTFIEKIFSVRNEGTRKVISFFGLKIRFRTPRLVYRELNARLDRQQDDFNTKFSMLQDQSRQFSHEFNSLLEKQKQEFNSKLINLLEQQSRSFISELSTRLAKVPHDDVNRKLAANVEKQAKIFDSKVRELNAKCQALLYKIHRYCPDEKRAIALKDWFYEHTGEALDLDNPQTYNEKIQWMKLNDTTPLKTLLADKYAVRGWVKEKIGEQYLIPLLGAWDKFDDIDFNALPKKFALKCNHGSGYNVIVTDKSKLDLGLLRRRINTWMSEDYAFKSGFELQYSAIPRKIVAEKYIENNDRDLFDYKFWCFDGKVKYIQFLSERYTNANGAQMAFYDRGWNKLNFIVAHTLDDKTIKKPDNLESMIELAEKLSSGFNYVRVDFYDVNNKIYFGEMTFTPDSGQGKWEPEEMNLTIGRMIKLPIKD